MGVGGGFARWLQGNFPEMMVPVKDLASGEGFDHILFDMNPLLHRAIHGAASESQLLYIVLATVELVLEYLGSSRMRTVGLFVDGTAPLAKLELQRARREGALKKQERKSSAVICPALLTAGSDVMHRVSEGLCRWSRTRLGMKMHSRTTFLCSGHDVAGEAETKMAKCIADSFTAGKDSVSKGVLPRVLLVGGDADLLMVGACASSAQVFVLQRTPEASGGWPEGDSAICLGKASGAWSAWGADAALIALLEGGNDYLPELRGVAVGDLWRQFAQLRSVWGGDGKLPMLLAISGEKGCRFCMGRMVELLSEGMGAWDENEVLWAPGGGVMFDVERYLECVLWIMGAHINGECGDYYHTRYAFPYAPSRRDVAKWWEMDGNKGRLIEPPHSREEPLCAAANFVVVMPEGARELLPPNLRGVCTVASKLADACIKGAGRAVPMDAVMMLKKAVSLAMGKSGAEAATGPALISRKTVDEKGLAQDYHPLERSEWRREGRGGQTSKRPAPGRSADAGSPGRVRKASKKKRR